VKLSLVGTFVAKFLIFSVFFSSSSINGFGNTAVWPAGAVREEHAKRVAAQMTAVGVKVYP
jgi:hypothetical protein